MGEVLQLEESIKLYENVYEKPPLDDIIEHHGILGMHWGKRNGPPYPLDSKVSTGKRLKSSSGKISRKRRKSLKKARKIKASNIKKRQEEEKKQEKIEKTKEEIIKSKDIKAMSRNIDKFSNQEINDMLNRLDVEKKLKDRVVAIEKANRSKGEKFKDAAKESIIKGLSSGARSLASTVSENALKMGVKKVVKELVGEDNKDLQSYLDQLFKEKKK